MAPAMSAHVSPSCGTRPLPLLIGLATVRILVAQGPPQAPCLPAAAVCSGSPTPSSSTLVTVTATLCSSAGGLYGHVVYVPVRKRPSGLSRGGILVVRGLLECKFTTLPMVNRSSVIIAAQRPLNGVARPGRSRKKVATGPAPFSGYEIESRHFQL